MVEEPDAGRDLDLAAVEVEGERDLGLARLALDLRRSRHRSQSTCKSSASDRRALCRLAVHGESLGAGDGRRPCGASAAAAASVGSATTEVRRMNARGPERPAEARSAAGRQHVVRARRVVAEGGRRRPRRRRRSPATRERAASSSAPSKASSRCSGAKRIGERRARPRAPAPRPAPAARRRRSGARRRAPRSGRRSLEQRRRRRDRRAAGCRRRARPGPAGRARARPGRRVASATTSSSVGPARPSMPTAPKSWRLASVTQRFPGPATTSTGSIVSVPSASAAIAWAPPIA